MSAEGDPVSNHLQFVCHTCRVRTGKLGERMNRQETTARGAVRARVQIRDACRAVSALNFASRESLAVFFGVGYCGSPEPDLHLLSLAPWFEQHAEHDMDHAGEWDFSDAFPDPVRGVYAIRGIE